MDSTAVVEIKSKFELEFRRLSLLRGQAEALSIDAFYRLITDTHRLPPPANVQIHYLDPRKNEQVPIEDAKELATAFKGAAPLLRLFVSRIRGAEVEVSGSEEEEEEENDRSNKKGDKRKGGGGKNEGGGGRINKGGREGCPKTTGGRGEVDGKEWTDSSSSQSGPCSEDTSAPSLNSRGQGPVEEQCRHPHRAQEGDPPGARDQTVTVGDDEVGTTHEEERKLPSAGLLDGTNKREGERLRVMADMLPKHSLVVMFEERRNRERAERDQALANAMNRLNLTQGAGSSLPGQRPACDYRSTPESPSAPVATSNGDDRFPFVIEIYGFDPALKTRDILREFQNYKQSEFRMKWVDDTHAIGIFASAKQAWLAAEAPYMKFKTRMVRDGTEQSISMAEKLAEEMRPQNTHTRPKTTAMVARRMVSSALGVRVQLSPGQREKERRELKEARERKASRQKP